MVLPVNVLGMHVIRVSNISTHYDAVDQTADQGQESKDEEHYTQDPHVYGLEKLYNNHESQRDKDDPQVEQQHQAAHALDVGTEGIRGSHGLHGNSSLARRPRLGCCAGDRRSSVTIASVRVVGWWGTGP